MRNGECLFPSLVSTSWCCTEARLPGMEVSVTIIKTAYSVSRVLHLSFFFFFSVTKLEILHKNLYDAHILA